MSALIDRQVAFAERSVKKINKILDDRVPFGEFVRLWVHQVERVHVRFATLPDRLADRLSAADIAVLQELISEALDELAISDEERRFADFPPEQDEPRAVVERVTTLADARAQAARLHARWLRLKARIVSLDGRDGSLEHH